MTEQQEVMCCKITTDNVVTFELILPTVQVLNEFVHGYIEMVPTIVPGHHAYINEEGKLKKLSLNRFATALAHNNRRLMDDHIVGNCIIFGSHAAPFEGPVTEALLEAMRVITDGLDDVRLP